MSSSPNRKPIVMEPSKEQHCGGCGDNDSKTVMRIVFCSNGYQGQSIPLCHDCRMELSLLLDGEI